MTPPSTQRASPIPFVGAAKAVVRKAKALPAVIDGTVDEYYSDTAILLITGAFMLAFVVLGSLVMQVARNLRLRD